MNKGFTLIELLVVVLIIGILAAVALPQYQMAVAKSRLASVLPLMKSIRTAQQIYFMANGKFSANPDEWDLSLPEGTTVIVNGEKSTILLKDNTRFSLLAVASPPGEPNPRLQASIPKLPVQVLMPFDADQWVCYPEGSELGVKLCKSLGCPNTITISTPYCRFSW